MRHLAIHKAEVESRLAEMLEEISHPDTDPITTILTNQAVLGIYLENILRLLQKDKQYVQVSFGTPLIRPEHSHPTNEL